MPGPLVGPPGFLPLHTLLTITPLSGGEGLTLTPYCARGLTQSLRQIGDVNNIRRTVIGSLVNAQPPWFNQYASTISCKDTEAPCLDGAFRGLICQVDCAAELNYVTGATPHRAVVTGSERSDPAAHITWYRPSLTMMVLDIDPRVIEYEGEWSWRIELQEVGLP